MRGLLPFLALALLSAAAAREAAAPSPPPAQPEPSSSSVPSSESAPPTTTTTTATSDSSSSSSSALAPPPPAPGPAYAYGPEWGLAVAGLCFSSDPDGSDAARFPGLPSYRLCFRGDGSGGGTLSRSVTQPRPSSLRIGDIAGPTASFAEFALAGGDRCPGERRRSTPLSGTLAVAWPSASRRSPGRATRSTCTPGASAPTWRGSKPRRRAGCLRRCGRRSSRPRRRRHPQRRRLDRRRRRRPSGSW